MTRYFFAAILAVLSLTVTACGGADEDVTEPATTPRAASPTEGTPTITNNVFESADNGYSVRFPEGWTPLPNFVRGPLQVDAFFGPEEVKGVKPNIAVTCEQLTKNLTLEEYFDSKAEVVEAVTKQKPEISSRQVSGQKALALQFERQELEPPIEKVEVVFVTDRCGWSVSLTVPHGERAVYEEVFDQFLESFQLLP